MSEIMLTTGEQKGEQNLTCPYSVFRQQSYRSCCKIVSLAAVTEGWVLCMLVQQPGWRGLPKAAPGACSLPLTLLDSLLGSPIMANLGKEHTALVSLTLLPCRYSMGLYHACLPPYGQAALGIEKTPSREGTILVPLLSRHLGLVSSSSCPGYATE